MKKIVIVFLVFMFASFLLGQNAWINELHYDDDGADENEFVEVVIENAGSYALSDFSIVLYNGNGGVSYDTKTLDQYTQGTTTNNFTFFYFNYTTNGGSIQNGAPDGLALVYQGTVISGQFLSYEGTFTATDGPANGMTSTDIGVSESGVPEGQSLQLTGSGTQYSDFTWGGPYAQTMGQPNSDGTNDQSLPVELTSFTASAENGRVTLKWTTASEVNNQGFVILRSVHSQNGFTELASYQNNPKLEGAGNASQKRSYSYVDQSVINGNTYYYKLVDVDMNGIRTEHGPVSATPQAAETDEGRQTPGSFFLKNYPNPFNPGTTISFDLSSFPEQNIPVTLTIYDAGGARVAVLYDGMLSAKAHSFRWNGLNSSGRMMPSGVYFYTLKSPLRTLTKKMMLLR